MKPKKSKPITPRFIQTSNPLWLLWSMKGLSKTISREGIMNELKRVQFLTMQDGTPYVLFYINGLPETLMGISREKFFEVMGAEAEKAYQL